MLELARQLSPRHDVHLVVASSGGCEGVAATVHALGLPARPALWLQPRFARRAAALIAREGFDVVHAIGGALPGATVVTAQYCHAAWLEAKRRYRVRDGALATRVYHRLVSRQSVAFERRAYASPALREVIAVSARTADELAAHYGVDRARVTVVHNGVDPAVFDRARYPGARDALRRTLGLAPQTPLALLVGTHARKGLATAIAAAARASDALHLVVAGSGDAALARRWAAQSGLGARLHLLGPRLDVAELFAAADLFVLPTRYEPFGMVIVEAMASSLPVVVSGCSGAAELIRHGENGFVVQAADDTDGFAAAIRAILADRALGERVGRAARATATTVAWSEVARRTEAVYARAAEAVR